MKSQELSSRLCAAFSQALTSILGSLTAKTFSLVSPGAAAQAGRELTVWQQGVAQADGQIRGTLSLATSADFSRAAGNLMLEAAGISNSSAEEIRDAWHEIAGRIFGQLIAIVNADTGGDLTLSAGKEVPHDPALEWTEIAVQGPGSIYRMLFSGPAESETSGWDELFATAGGQSAVSLAAGSDTFNLLLDVALPVAVSFGRTSLQIREVLKLNSGSIIELNRLVSEPVDVVVNDSVIARGEVVVVDGNYGVRITQIASREDRIRTGMAGVEPVAPGVGA